MQNNWLADDDARTDFQIRPVLGDGLGSPSYGVFFLCRPKWKARRPPPTISPDWRRLESDFQRTLEAEKLEAMAEFAAGAGHEINNPLTVISGRAQLLLRDEPDAERRHALALISTQAMRVYEMIADMMLFARPPRPELQQVELIELVDAVVADLSPRAAGQETAIHRSGDPGPIFAEADPVQYRLPCGRYAKTRLRLCKAAATSRLPSRKGSARRHFPGVPKCGFTFATTGRGCSRRSDGTSSTPSIPPGKLAAAWGLASRRRGASSPITAAGLKWRANRAAERPSRLCSASQANRREPSNRQMGQSHLR